MKRTLFALLALSLSAQAEISSVASESGLKISDNVGRAGMAAVLLEQQGGIIKMEAPIDASNVMLLHKGQATRVGFKMEGDKKVRVAKATGAVID